MGPTESGVGCAGAQYWTSNRCVYVNIDRPLLSAQFDCGRECRSPLPLSMIDLRQIDRFFYKTAEGRTSQRILKAIVV